MQPSAQPPFIPILQFFNQFSNLSRVWFAVIWVLLAVSINVAWRFHADPTVGTVEVREVSEVQAKSVAIDQIHHNYRTFDLNFQVYSQRIAFSAGPIIPANWPLFLFWGMQIIAWCSLLLAASQIKSRWAFLFYGLHAFFIYFSGVSSGLYHGSDPIYPRLIGFGVILTFLGLAYAFQSNTLKWALPARMASMFALHAGWFGAAFWIGGVNGMHKSATDLFMYEWVLLIILLIFWAKEIPVLIAALMNHRKGNKPDYRLMIVALVAFGLLCLYQMAFYLKLGFAQENLPLLRPIHLAGVGFLVAAFTSQILFPIARNIFTSLGNLVLLMASLALIGGSFWMWQAGSGDPLSLFALDRLASITLASGAIGGILYLLANFKTLFSRKIPAFWMLGQGPAFSIVVVILMGLAFILGAEGRESKKSFFLTYAAYINHQADQARLTGDAALARQRCENAVLAAESDVKANYNLAAWNLELSGSVDQAIENYQAAASALPFSFANLNAANLRLLQGQRAAARQVLEAGINIPGTHKALLYNNLAMSYWQDKQTDNAVEAFRKALQEDPSLSSAYSNLGLLYLENDLTKDAQEFLEAAVEVAKPSDAARANAYFGEFYLKKPLSGLDPSWDPAGKDYFAAYHHALSRLQAGDTATAWKLAAALSTDEKAADAKLLHAWLRFSRDSIQLATTEADYVRRTFPGYEFQAPYLMGLAYFQRDVPEMARKYFAEAGKVNPTGMLFAGQMDLDLHRLDSAQAELSLLRGLHPEMQPACGKELALLLLSFGELVYAQSETNLASLSTDDYIRAALYADSMGRFGYAISNIREAILLDSSSISPYLALGRLLNTYGDTLAFSTVKYGLSLVDPASVPLKLELARAYLLQGQTKEVQALLKETATDPVYVGRRALLEADLSLSLGDTAKAAQQYLDLFRKDVLHTPAVLRLLELWSKKGLIAEGLNVSAEAIDYNDQNADIWYWYAWFSQQAGMQSDAGFGAIKAIELSADPEFRKRVAVDFADQIKLIVQQ